MKYMNNIKQGKTHW